VANKSYDQYCPVALTLDAVGDRWTLLIVRELLYGPLRYSDLQSALPGIPPNLLASRLRDLESDGLVERQTLPPPVARTVFALTPDGRDLERVVRDLGRWGLRRLPPPEDDSDVAPAMALRSGLLTFAQPRRADPGDRTWVVMLGDETFTLLLENGRVRAQRGRAERADVVARIRPAALLRHRVAGETGARRAPPPVTFVEGSDDRVAEFERVFDLATPVSPAVAARR
jgi:DNA-binding HxlR family transcriptional regulator